MKTFLTLIFIFNIFFLSAQTKADTLIINNNKLKLIPTEKFYDLTQQGSVLLISEYQDEDRIFKVNYKTLNRFAYKITLDVAYGTIGATLISDSGRYYDIILHNVIDTIILADKKQNIIPYIKTGNTKYYFCGFELYRLRNDTVTSYNFKSTYSDIELIFDSIDYADQIQIKTRDSFYLTKIYYRKNDATYYLDRTIIIKIE